MLAFRLFPPPHGMPMAGAGVPHTKCGTKRAWRARNKGGTLVPPMSPIGEKGCAAACGARKSLRKMLRRGRVCLVGICAAVLPGDRRGLIERLSGVCPTSVGCLSDICRTSVETLSGIDRMPARHLPVPYQIQRCQNNKRFSRNGNTAKARRKDRNYNISAMPDPAALCATAK